MFAAKEGMESPCQAFDLISGNEFEPFGHGAHFFEPSRNDLFGSESSDVVATSPEVATPAVGALESSLKTKRLDEQDSRSHGARSCISSSSSALPSESSTKRKRRPRRNLLPPEIRRMRRLERNRASAQRCRLRVKTELEQLRAENDALRAAITLQDAEISRQRGLLDRAVSRGLILDCETYL
eukprot:Rmarinus@m.10176